MIKKLILALACMVIAAQALANDCCYSTGSTDCFGFDSVLTFDIGGGYRTDKIHWKTLPVTAPGTALKEQWNNLNMGVVETNTQFLACEHYLFTFDFDYAWFNQGGKQRTELFNFNTGLLQERLKAQTNGRAYNIDGALGYQFNWCCYRYSLVPLVGYSYHFQKLKNHKYINELSPGTERFVRNNYKYRWRGPTIGFSTAFQIDCFWQVFFNYTFHWLRYRGKVVDAFVVGSHPGHQKSNNCHGNEFTLGTTYEFCPDWLFTIRVNYKNFLGNKGHFETQSTPHVKEFSPLRKLHWESLTATADVGYVF